MAESSVPASSRRVVLAGAGAACAAALAGCARYNSNNGGVNGSQATPASSTPAAAAGGSSGAAPAGPPVLASTSDIPVGGGKILADKKIVITQPKAGTFAFTAVCTHQGCIVGSVTGGTINCPCHGSKFNITNGSVVNGPAASPLAPVSIKVQGTSIVQA